MDISRISIVAAARSQLGVKYQKDAEVPNLAMHCTGLISYALKAGIGLTLPKSVEQGPIAGFTDGRILDFLEEFGCEEINRYEALPGDIIVWNYGGAPHHTGLITKTDPEIWVIHSSATYGKVAEHPLGCGQWIRRLNSVWSITAPLQKFVEETKS